VSTTILVKVAVDQATVSYDKEYTYLWPADLGTPQKGVRVLVPFGNGNRRRQGLVLEILQGMVGAGYKPVYALIDDTPILDDEMLALARFVQERTLCPFFDAVRAMLPTGLYMQVKPVLRHAAEVSPEVLETLSPNQRQILAYVSKCPGGVELSTLCKRLGLQEDAPCLHYLIEQKVLLRSEDAVRRMGDASVQMVRRMDAPSEEAASKLTDKQQAVLNLLDDVGAASVKEVCYFAGVTPVVVHALARKGLAEIYEAERLRSPYACQAEDKPIVSHCLSPEQQRAFATLQDLYMAGKAAAALLYGVTGSGKTAVYLNLIDRVLADGRQVIVLVPEISLTPQMMSIFIGKYGHRVAVLHSGLALGERMDEWKRIKRGEARIVVGTRSAIFAPCTELGLIVMDEEQEHTYKSESSPRYHARDIARFRCAHHGALLVLASATPSVESYYAATTGRYTLVELTERYGDALLPEVEVADMREDPAPYRIIGSRLQQEMQACLDEGRQVILLLNRRGYHTHISCRSCGQVVTCPSCSISMTYHRANARMMCHYCGHSQLPPQTCPQCGSDKIRYAGLGTQLVEQELETLFPDIPVLRMDADSTLSRHSYERHFGAFAAGDYRIMVGTQMVAKGLDFPQVGLVGVLSVDQSLYGDDYRSYETTFSLLTQVIGRAGRRQQRGKAIIQTFTPDNPIIELASMQDYVGFYGLEIASRRMMHYPPYADLFLFGFVGQQEEQVRRAGNWMLKHLRTLATGEYDDLPLIALDPTPASVLRVAGKYRYKMLVKARNTQRMREMIRLMVQEFHKDPSNRGVSVYTDINPAAML